MTSHVSLVYFALLYFFSGNGNVHRLFESCILGKYSRMVSRLYVFANGFLKSLAMVIEKDDV